MHRNDETFDQIVDSFRSFGTKGNEWYGIELSLNALGEDHFNTASLEGLISLLEHIGTFLTSPAVDCGLHANTPSAAGETDEASSCLHVALDRSLRQIKQFLRRQLEFHYRLRTTVPCRDANGRDYSQYTDVSKFLASSHIEVSLKVKLFSTIWDLMKDANLVRSVHDHLEQLSWAPSLTDVYASVASTGWAIGQLILRDPALVGVFPLRLWDRLCHFLGKFESSSAEELVGQPRTAEKKPDEVTVWLVPPLAAAVELARVGLAFGEWLRQRAESEERLIDTLEDFEELLSRKRPPPALSGLSSTQLSDFVLGGKGTAGWPGSIPECEVLIRTLVTEGADGLLDSTLPNQHLSFNVAHRTVVVIPPDITQAPPSSRVRLGNRPSRAALLRNWLEVGSDEYFAVERAVVAAIKKARRDATLQRRVARFESLLLKVAAAGAGAAVAVDLTALVFPDLPENLSAAAGAIAEQIAEILATVHRPESERPSNLE